VLRARYRRAADVRKRGEHRAHRLLPAGEPMRCPTSTPRLRRRLRPRPPHRATTRPREATA